VNFFARLSRIPKRIRFVIIPYLWPLISSVLNRISKFSHKVDPYSQDFDQAVFLRSDSLKGKIIGVDLTSAARDWISCTLRLEIFSEINSSSDLSGDFKEKILAIDYEWIYSIHEKPFMLFKIAKLSFKARRLKMPVWIFLGDSFAVRYLPATCFLVAFCGGSVILQPNTMAEGEEFGIVFPTGPFLWTMSEKNVTTFYSDLKITDRPKVVVLAGTGEVRRMRYMRKLATRLKEIGWDSIFSDGKLSWEDYVKQSKNTSAVATTNWMHKIHVRGTKKTRSKIATSTTTHRVWEGFASGTMVMTQRTKVLDYFGFIPGRHYFELWSEVDLDTQISFVGESQISSIASSGQKLLLEVLKQR